MSISEENHFAQQQGSEIELNEEEEERFPDMRGGRSGTMDRVGEGLLSLEFLAYLMNHRNPAILLVRRRRAQFILKDEHTAL